MDIRKDSVVEFAKQKALSLGTKTFKIQFYHMKIIYLFKDKILLIVFLIITTDLFLTK